MRFRFFFAVTTAVAGSLFAGALASAQLPSLPGVVTAQPASTIPPPGVDYPPAAASAVVEAARRGVVALEQSGRTVGLGVVLGADSRILTALSVLGGAEVCDVKYMDGHRVRARVGHKDAALDLALLIPLSGRYADGLAASARDLGNVELYTFGAAPQIHSSGLVVKVKARGPGRARDSVTFSEILDLDAKSQPLVGAPLLDGAGGVAGLVVRMCRPSDAATCVPMVAAQPLVALRNFLVRTPVDAVPPSPWLGIQGSPDSSGGRSGVRVLAVAPGSPAQVGGLKAGDLVAAVDGAAVDSPEQLQALIGGHAVGDSVKLTLLFQEKSRDTVIALRAAP